MEKKTPTCNPSPNVVEVAPRIKISPWVGVGKACDRRFTLTQASQRPGTRSYPIPLEREKRGPARPDGSFSAFRGELLWLVIVVVVAGERSLFGCCRAVVWC